VEVAGGRRSRSVTGRASERSREQPGRPVATRSFGGSGDLDRAGEWRELRGIACRGSALPLAGRLRRAGAVGGRPSAAAGSGKARALAALAACDREPRVLRQEESVGERALGRAAKRRSLATGSSEGVAGPGTGRPRDAVRNRPRDVAERRGRTGRRVW